MSTENAVYSIYLESSRHPLTDKIEPLLLLARSLILLRNSGGQIIFSNLVHALNRAKRFKPPLRQLMIEMAMADVMGIITISSEGGAALRELNTVRSSVPVGALEGQEKTWLDEYYHEELLGNKGLLKNNKLKDGYGIDIDKR